MESDACALYFYHISKSMINKTAEFEDILMFLSEDEDNKKNK